MILSMLTAPVAAIPLVGSSDSPVIEHTLDGEPRPSAIVHVSNGSLDSLEGWAEESADRELVKTYPEHDRAVIAAPTLALYEFSPSRAGSVVSEPSALLATPLVEQSWVNTVRPNFRVTLDRPTDIDESQFEPPNINPLGVGDPAHPVDGVAFADTAQAGTMNDSREAINETAVAADTSGVTVAVLDTGANTANGRLFGNGLTGSAIRIHNASKDYVANETVDGSADDYSAVEDGNGHGTWVASSIAANTSNAEFDGVAPEATLLVMRTLNDDGEGATADIAIAIRDAADENASIISMSLGSPLYSEELADAVQYARDSGSVVVAAAGNSRIERGANIGSPGDVEGVITVGATDVAGPLNANSSYFSQVGPDPGTLDDSGGATADASVDVVAPGQEVTAKVAGTDSGLSNNTLSGTSMATPQVSGALAIAMGYDSTLAEENASAIEERVRDTAEPVPNAAAVEAGEGMVNAGNLATDTEPVIDQENAMDSAASQRDEFYRRQSTAAGRTLARLLN